MLKDAKVISYLNILQEQYVVCPIGTTANNIAFICQKCYVQVLLKELRLLNTTLDTYQQMNDTLHNVLQQQNNTLHSVYRLKSNDAELSCHPCIYWVPKIHKRTSSAKFIIAGKKCTNK